MAFFIYILLRSAPSSGGSGVFKYSSTRVQYSTDRLEFELDVAQYIRRINFCLDIVIRIRSSLNTALALPEASARASFIGSNEHSANIFLFGTRIQEISFLILASSPFWCEAQHDWIVIQYPATKPLHPLPQLFQEMTGTAALSNILQQIFPDE